MCCAAVAVIAKWDVLSPESLAQWVRFSDSSASDFECEISGTSVPEKNFCIFGSGVMYLSDTSVVQLSKNGEKDFLSQHSFTNPIIKSSEKYAVAFNEGGSDFRIFSDKKEEFRAEQGTSITDCSINDLGIYGIISDQTGYLSKLFVYNKNNELIYSYSFNDFYAVCVSISPDGAKAVVGAVNTVSGQMVSKIYLLDFMKTEPLYVFTYTDQIIYDAEFVDDDKCAVVTDSLLSVIYCDSGKEIPFSFSSKALTSYSLSFGEDIVLSLSHSGDMRDCEIVTIDTKGNEKGRFDTKLKVYSLDVCKDRIAVLSGSMLYLKNAYGDSFGEWDVGSDAKNVLIPQEKTAYILGVSQVRRMSLK